MILPLLRGKDPVLQLLRLLRLLRLDDRHLGFRSPTSGWREEEARSLICTQEFAKGKNLLDPGLPRWRLRFGAPAVEEMEVSVISLISRHSSRGSHPFFTAPLKQAISIGSGRARHN